MANGIDPEHLARLGQYCARDVEVERELYLRIPALSDDEQRLWQLDAIINRRGFHVDVALAKAAQNIVVERKAVINAELAELTAGRITSINQVGKLTDYLRERGHKVDSIG